MLWERRSISFSLAFTIDAISESFIPRRYLSITLFPLQQRFTDDPYRRPMWPVYLVAVVYALTVKLSLVGNLWVIASILRSRRPHNTTAHSSPADR